MKEQRLYENFEMYFPYVAKTMVAYTTVSDCELVINLRDGTDILYDDMEKTIRTLPQDRHNMTEDQCKDEFGIRLRKMMGYKGMTQSVLSQITGINQPLISNYLSGKNTPSFYNVDKIAKALNCSVDDFRYF